MDMYAKCRNMENSLEIFSSLQDANEVSWNTIIVGYCQSGFAEDALSVFHEMRAAHMLSTQVTFSSVLRACANTSSIKHAVQIHSLIEKSTFNNDTIVDLLCENYDVDIEQAKSDAEILLQDFQKQGLLEK